VWKPPALAVKKSKMQYWDNFGHQLLASQQSVLQTIWCVHGKNLILLDTAKTKIVSCSAMRWEDSFKYLVNLASVINGHTVLRCIWGGKYHWCSQNLPNFQNTKGCRLRWNLTWNAQSLQLGYQKVRELGYHPYAH